MKGETREEARPARLLIADDHDLVREGLLAVLEGEPGLEVVGEAKNGEEALQACRELHPDLVLMDVRMPEMDGLEATRTIKAQQPEVSVLVVSTYENPDYLLEALKAGAAGYVLKDAPRDEVITALRRVREGEASLDPELAARLLRRLATEGQGAGEPVPPTRVLPMRSRLASWRCWGSSNWGAAIARSPKSCSSAGAPSSATSRT